MFSSLYVSRPLLNGGEVLQHFAAQGLRTVVDPSQMHVTLVYSKQPLLWENVTPEAPSIIVTGGKRSVERLGDHGAIVLRFESPALQARHITYRRAGASSDYPQYLAHVTVSYDHELNVSGIKPFPGPLYFGPEIRAPISTEWTPDRGKEVLVEDLLEKAIVAPLTVVVKARAGRGRRVVEVEASCEDEDTDGDVVLQQALLGSADSFVATGHLDIDHLSEFGARLGIPNPSSFIVGRPLSVSSRPGNRTFVEGEIAQALDGVDDPRANRFDELWASLQRNPPVQWFSSIYGFPTSYEDCTTGACTDVQATRYVIKALDWRSLAFTRSPKNTGLRSPTRIVTAKAYIAELAKGMPAPTVPLPNTMSDVWAQHQCLACSVHKAPSLLGYRMHFAKCLGFPKEAADLYAHATMHRHAMQSAFPVDGL